MAIKDFFIKIIDENIQWVKTIINKIEKNISAYDVYSRKYDQLKSNKLTLKSYSYNLNETKYFIDANDQKLILYKKNITTPEIENNIEKNIISFETFNEIEQKLYVDGKINISKYLSCVFIVKHYI
jgi:hypothetical protein